MPDLTSLTLLQCYWLGFTNGMLCVVVPYLCGRQIAKHLARARDARAANRRDAP